MIFLVLRNFQNLIDLNLSHRCQSFLKTLNECVFFVIPRNTVPTIVGNLVRIQNFGKWFIKKDSVRIVSDHFIFLKIVLILVFVISVIVADMTNTHPFCVNFVILKVNLTKKIIEVNHALKAIRIFYRQISVFHVEDYFTVKGLKWILWSFKPYKLKL